MPTITISGIRQKYPQYNDLSDSELADKFHSKSYPDMPKEEFNEKIGLNRESHPFRAFAAGLGQVGENIYSSVNREEPHNLMKSYGINEPTQTDIYAQKFGNIAGPLAIALASKGKILPAASMIGKEIASDVGAALKPVAHKAIEKTFPSPLSAEELQANLDLTRGTQTGLGDIIGSPRMKGMHENVLAYSPFSGVSEAMLGAGQSTINRAGELFPKLIGENEAYNIPEQLQNALASQMKSIQSEIKSGYEDVEALAKEAGLQLNPSKFSEAAKKYAKQLSSSELLNADQEMSGMIGKLKKFGNASDVAEDTYISAFGTPVKRDIKYPSLQEANILKGKLSQYARELKRSPDMKDRLQSNIFSDLSRTLKQDILKSIQKTKNPELLSKYEGTEKLYAEKLSKFFDKDVYHHATKQKSSDTIVQDFLKRGKITDQEAKLAKLIDKLPADKKNLVAADYLGNAVEGGVVNPAKLKSLVGSLGERQFAKLIENPEITKELQDIIKLYEMNASGTNMMVNRLTGQTSRDTQFIEGLKKVLGVIGGSVTGIAPTIGTSLLGRAFSSPKFREEYVTKLINARKGPM